MTSSKHNLNHVNILQSVKQQVNSPWPTCLQHDLKMLQSIKNILQSSEVGPIRSRSTGSYTCQWQDGKKWLIKKKLKLNLKGITMICRWGHVFRTINIDRSNNHILLGLYVVAKKKHSGKRTNPVNTACDTGRPTTLYQHWLECHLTMHQGFNFLCPDHLWPSECDIYWRQILMILTSEVDRHTKRIQVSMYNHDNMYNIMTVDMLDP